MALADDPQGLSLRHLVLWNEALVGLVCLVLAIVHLRAGKSARSSREARRIQLVLLAGLVCWILEPLANAHDRRLFFLLNAGVAAAFLHAGRALFLLKSRLHRLMRPESPDASRWWRPVQRLVTARASSSAALAFIALSLATSWILASSPPAHGNLDRADLPAAVLSCAGMLVLGLGLLREFTREKPELVSLACGAAVVLYGVVQLFRVWQPWQGPVLLVAILLKVTFLIALASFWTLVHEMARARETSARRWEESARDASRLSQAAMDLHDTVLNTLQGLSLWAGLARRKLDDEPGAAVEPLERLTGGIQACAASMRAILEGLPPAELARNGLRAALEELLHAIRARSTLETELDWRVDGPIAREIEEGLAAIAFEACHNVEQHARARGLTVRCVASNGQLELSVDDDGNGRGSAAPTGNGRGLDNMRARSLALGARFDAGPGPEGGTRIRVEIEGWRR
jgi:signal transduction histidine kinase